MKAACSVTPRRAAQALLFVAELRAYMTVRVVTDVVMDGSPDGTDLQINFELSMPDLVCQVTWPARSVRLARWRRRAGSGGVPSCQLELVSGVVPA